MQRTMLPFMFLFSIGAIDELNGWERFRMSLPISRRNVVLGRYASAAIVSILSLAVGIAIGAIITAAAGALPLPDEAAAALSWDNNPIDAIIGASAAGVGIIMVTMSVTLPLIMRYGMTKAVRIIPIAFLLLFCLGLGAISQGLFGAEGLEGVVEFILGGNASAPAIAAAALAIVAAIYALSAAVAVKMYAKREL